uniref:YD repeat-containing protein n=1 Tax=Candidatus Kentrum sp. MB TaxID=2138164 RepID=A0A450X0Z4_9GAMM|nr:MAG: hypothetical protein BECKMB1821G_GA0114241_100332 [Candidatus Kentron sp. MB]VFK26510.1 MAG: hypothetical protein BECKMB1821I_GA0114274_100119 [Candidatus Kentron sp. MB]VFK74564.1 MAG: hypothetical protein BECKMB1821H_GA0114242_100655 [Candidatus Kentron sp. MB]
MQENGCHKITVRYDEHGNQTELVCLRAVGEPKYKLAFRENGTKSQQILFAPDGRVSTKYNEQGKQTEESYFDVAGQPVLHEYGYHKITYHYDKNGNLSSGRYFNTEGKELFPFGIKVISVLPDSQGEKLGIQAGDEFIRYDGRRFVEVVKFVAYREAEPADGPAKILEVLRGANRLQFKIKPGKIGVQLRTQLSVKRQ